MGSQDKVADLVRRCFHNRQCSATPCKHEIGAHPIWTMSNNGHRLAFLVVESEPSQGLSTRKLLLESGKHNVVTAYSSEEGIRMFKRFPSVDAVVVDSELPGNEGFARWVKEQNHRIRVVRVSPREAAEASWADETMNSHDPAGLLELLEGMGGHLRLQQPRTVQRHGRKETRHVCSLPIPRALAEASNTSEAQCQMLRDNDKPGRFDAIRAQATRMRIDSLQAWLNSISLLCDIVGRADLKVAAEALERAQTAFDRIRRELAGSQAHTAHSAELSARVAEIETELTRAAQRLRIVRGEEPYKNDGNDGGDELAS